MICPFCRGILLAGQTGGAARQCRPFVSGNECSQILQRNRALGVTLYALGAGDTDWTDWTSRPMSILDNPSA